MADLAALLRARPFAQQMTGLVTAVTAGAATTAATITVNAGGGPCAGVPCLAGYTPAVGDCALLLIVDRRMYALGKFSTPAAPDPLPPLPPDDAVGTTVFPATAAGTYLDGVWRADRTDVIQGPEPADGRANTGVWCYADVPAGTLSGAVVSSARVWLRRWPVTAGADVTVGLVLHNLPAPGAAPTVLDTAAVPGIGPAHAGWVDVPTGWAADIANPASPARGIGVATADPAHYATFASLLADAQTGALSIVWSR